MSLAVDRHRLSKLSCLRPRFVMTAFEAAGHCQPRWRRSRDAERAFYRPTSSDCEASTAGAELPMYANW